MAACVVRTMEEIPEEVVAFGSPKRKRSLNINMPWTTLSDEERCLGIYEDNTNGDDLSDSDEDYCYVQEEVEENNEHVGNHGNGFVEKSKMQKLDFTNFVVPPKPKGSESVDVNINGVRAKAGTPTTEYSEISEIRDIESGKNSRLGVESREAVYKKAMDLMTVRCTSVQANNVTDDRDLETPLLCVKNQPYGTSLPKYFYVQQNRPLPMAPLKAWRGYNGNVYFQPMNVSQVKCGAPERQTPDIEKCSEKLKKILEPRFKTPDTSPTQSTRPSTRAEKRNKSRNESDLSSQTQAHMAVSISDKKAILNRLNQKLREDESWPEPKETIGSLKVDPNVLNKTTTKNKEKPAYQRDKICKGSVAHKVAAQRKAQPFFSINGGKFVAPTTMSPLLRTQTQYSQSNQRLGMNTPDLYNSSAYEKLPPLEQLRASLRHIENAPDKQMVVVPPANTRGQPPKVKPAYVKYSHDQYSNSSSVKQTSRS